MQTEKLFPSDLIQKKKNFQKSQLIVPLFASHSEAKKQLRQQIKRGEAWLLTYQQQQLFVAFTEQEGLAVLTNLLYYPLSEFSWIHGLKMLENFFRQHFTKGILLPVSLGIPTANWLIEQGYKRTAAGFQKIFDYQTALVLGGGGAKGAYQIGVWQALKSEGIAFDWITGTSVGALNGALILMDDVDIARELWLTISTDKVLAFPEASATSQSLRELVHQVRSLARTAIRENGASSEPLQKLLRETFDAEKMKRHPAKLLVCATRFSGLQEVIHPFDVENGINELDWLIASASFYPGMTPKEIEQELYVDGGYRNNLPIDVAIAQGASECICVDVKGPGIVKKTAVPLEVARMDLGTPWSLGNLLVFDRERSETNYRLGYLETMKYLGRFSGYWYTFTEGSPYQKIWRRFLRTLKTEPLYLELIQRPEFWEKVGKVYQQKAALEEGGQILLELIARVFEVAPTHVYNEESFLEEILQCYREGKGAIIGSLSIGEWLQQYHNQRFVLSEKNQLTWLYQILQAKESLPATIFTLAPITAVAARFLYYLLKEEIHEIVE